MAVKFRIMCNDLHHGTSVVKDRLEKEVAEQILEVLKVVSKRHDCSYFIQEYEEARQ